MLLHDASDGGAGQQAGAKVVDDAVGLVRAKVGHLASTAGIRRDRDRLPQPADGTVEMLVVNPLRWRQRHTLACPDQSTEASGKPHLRPEIGHELIAVALQHLRALAVVSATLADRGQHLVHERSGSGDRRRYGTDRHHRHGTPPRRQEAWCEELRYGMPEH